MNLKFKEHKYCLGIGLSVFILGLLCGFLLLYILKPAIFKPSVVSPLRESGYKYISPLLDFDQSEEYFVELKPFKKRIVEEVNKMTSSGQASEVAVYFRDLNNGPWYGVNELEDFYPASLLKVPLMVAYFKIAEDDPQILKKTLVYRLGSEESVSQNIVPERILEQGKSYTVEDLIYNMIVYSDNNALSVLVDNLDFSALAKIYEDFNIQLPSTLDSEVQVSVKTYASLFRMLFNASYLSKKYSEEALEMLSQSSFKEGLVAGVPPGIDVAHKFGERQLGENGVRQLHDCGIIYYPKHPYLLCVMTRGKDLDQLEQAIQNISGLIYTQVNFQFSAGRKD